VQQFVALVFGGSYFPVRGSLAGYLFWVVRELAWWWAATVLAAALVRQVLDGAAIRDLRSLPLILRLEIGARERLSGARRGRAPTLG
jgi:hypothetical protein